MTKYFLCQSMFWCSFIIGSINCISFLLVVGIITVYRYHQLHLIRDTVMFPRQGVHTAERKNFPSNNFETRDLGSLMVTGTAWLVDFLL